MLSLNFLKKYRKPTTKFLTQSDGLGYFLMEKDEIDLLKKEMVKLFIKSSLVMLLGKVTLVGLIWKKKTYNPDMFSFN